MTEVLPSRIKVIKTLLETLIKAVSKRNAKPTENRTVSTRSSSFNFSLRIRNPGRKVKQQNPKTCLATGISKNTVTKTMNCKINITARKFIDFPLVDTEFI